MKDCMIKFIAHLTTEITEAYTENTKLFFSVFSAFSFSVPSVVTIRIAEYVISIVRNCSSFYYSHDSHLYYENLIILVHFIYLLL